MEHFFQPTVLIKSQYQPGVWVLIYSHKWMHATEPPPLKNAASFTYQNIRNNMILQIMNNILAVLQNTGIADMFYSADFH